MKLWSDSWGPGDRIAPTYAAGRLDGDAGVTFSDNVNPHLAWSGLPDGTRSLVVICHDFDVPSRGDDVNQAGREVPADLPRVDFFIGCWSICRPRWRRSARANSAAASRRAANPARPRCMARARA